MHHKTQTRVLFTVSKLSLKRILSHTIEGPYSLFGYGAVNLWWVYSLTWSLISGRWSKYIKENQRPMVLTSSKMTFLHQVLQRLWELCKNCSLVLNLVLLFEDHWLQVTECADHHLRVPQTANSKVLHNPVVGAQFKFQTRFLGRDAHISGTHK